MRTLPIVGKLTVLTPLGATRRPPLYKTWDVSCKPEFPRELGTTPLITVDGSYISQSTDCVLPVL